MSDDLVTGLLPALGGPRGSVFNVFDVMHHGLHEKQISNVFRWLLDADGSHNLGDTFTRIFIEELNRTRKVNEQQFPSDGYWVRQEVNTSGPTEPGDIADLVLECPSAVVVVENYFTSDGHGHSYDRYLAYSERGGCQGAVVLLCRDEDRSLQTKGWEQAAVVTYGTLAGRLHDELADDYRYQRTNPEAYSFIQQMHSMFGKGRSRMEDHDVLGFVVAMCETGEARRYRAIRQDVAAEQFASDLAEQARERFGEGRVLLQRVKARLRTFGSEHLSQQLNESLGSGFVREVNARYSGIYQWTINFDTPVEGVEFGEAPLQLKFGPSAWFAIEQDTNWHQTADAAVADYSRLFITWSKRREVRQSSVTLREVVDGLEPTDRRLHDEILQAIGNRPVTGEGCPL